MSARAELGRGILSCMRAGLCVVMQIEGSLHLLGDVKVNCLASYMGTLNLVVNIFCGQIRLVNYCLTGTELRPVLGAGSGIPDMSR